MTSAAARRDSRLTRHAPQLTFLVVLSTAASLLVLEGATRVYAGLTNQERGMTFDAELGWRPLPRVTKAGAIWGVSRPATTNSLGWRDREHRYEKPPGVRRAVAIGDSFTFGMDVDDGERFTDELPRRIDRLEVVNLGVAGYGTDQELRLLETEGVLYQPDVVILTVCVVNDLDDITYDRLYSWPKPHYSLENGGLRLWKPVATWGVRARESSYLLEFTYQRFMTGVNKSRRVAGFAAETAPAVFEALIQRIAAVAGEHGARLVAVIAYGPTTMTRDFSDLGRYVNDVLARKAVPTLDTRQLFADRSPDPDRLLYSPRGLHWNAQGHAIVAEGIQSLLARVGIH